MTTCYIVTYYLQGACVVDANAVTSYHDEGNNHCRLHFADGSELRLDEACEAFVEKRKYCKKEPEPGLPIFPKSKS